MSGPFGRAARRSRGFIAARRPVAALAVLVLVTGGSAALALSRPAAAAAGVDCQVSYTNTVTWRGGFTTAVSVENLGSPVTHWALAFTLPGDETVAQNWDAVYSQSGQQVTATNDAFNAAVGTDKTAGMGFNVTYPDRVSPGDPSSFTLNGAPCTLTVSPSPAPTDSAAPSSAPSGAPSQPPGSGASQTPDADGHIFESSDRFAQHWVGGYTIGNDEWGSGFDTQTLWVNSATDWGLTATQPDTPGVKSYADISKSVNLALNSVSSATSSFDETNPQGGNWESAYDIWLNGTGIEVMAWTYTNGAARPLGRPETTVTLDGATWTLFVGDNGHNPTYSFERQGNETSGTVNLLDLLKYLENTGGYFSNPVLSTIQYGWEITGTGNTPKNFTMNNYSADVS